MGKHRAAEIDMNDIDRDEDLTCQTCGDTGQVTCTHPVVDAEGWCMDEDLCGEWGGKPRKVTCRGCVDWR